ncbi:MAG TPA: hypothetical protein VF158_11065 [Longimicrobiales bacterium]
MGGKRPDQYRVDYDEAGATDYKSYPDEPGETRHDYGLYGRVMKGNARAKQPIPPAAPEPHAEHDRLVEWERQQHLHEQDEERTGKAPGGEPEPPGG